MSKSLLILLLLLVVPVNAKDWRGIKPLYSTREDVERLLGPPTVGRADTTYYQFEKERVSFEYSTGRCANGWQVPRNTVISVWVSLKAGQVRFGDLKLDLKAYRKTQDEHVLYIHHYLNKTEGERYEVDSNSGDVILIEYFPAAQDENLRCPENAVAESEPLVLKNSVRSFLPVIYQP